MEEAAPAASVILVADDEEAVRMVTARALEHAGYRVITAADGRECVSLFAAHAAEVGCVLLDHTMPGLDGREAIAGIRAIRADARIILMSGFAEEDLAPSLDELPNGFIQKPFDIATLQHAVRAALG